MKEDCYGVSYLYMVNDCEWFLKTIVDNEFLNLWISNIIQIKEGDVNNT